MSAITKSLKPYLGATEEIYSIKGRIQIAADGSVSGEDLIGMSAAKTGTGQYTLTFDKNAKPQAVRNVQVQMMAATAVDLVPQLVSITNSAIVIKTLAAAVATNPAAVCEMMVSIDCRKSSVRR